MLPAAHSRMIGLFFLLFVVGVCLATAGLLGIGTRSPAADVLRVPARRAVTTPGVVSKRVDADRMVAASAEPAMKAKAQSLDDLSWQEFELLVGELFRRQGYTVQMCSGDGADGGVDLRVTRNDHATLVQCKHWRVYRVGPAPVRELFGVMVSERANRAVLLTTGRFTQDAVAFAQGKPLELIDGKRLAELVEQRRYAETGDLLDVASWVGNFARTAVITNPVCPFCCETMVLRTWSTTRERFWGCREYPRCRGKRNVRHELLAA